MSCTIDEAKTLRVQTEAAIMKLLNILSDRTKCNIQGVDLDKVESAGGKTMGHIVRIEMVL